MTIFYSFHTLLDGRVSDTMADAPQGVIREGAGTGGRPQGIP